jgi:hypothetical protein
VFLSAVWFSCSFVIAFALIFSLLCVFVCLILAICFLPPPLAVGLFCPLFYSRFAGSRFVFDFYRFKPLFLLGFTPD